MELLKAKYRLVSGPVTTDAAAQAWLGVDEENTQYLIKIWMFETERPDDLGRALWDAELRMLYRVGSSPGAEESLLVLRDAGVDRENRCFVMVLEAPGYESLETVVTHRGGVPWLATKELQVRRRLWASIRRLASGIRLLHDQNILHRNLGADAVFFNKEIAADSLRLGGFEWSVRLGTPQAQAPPPSWSSPPEFFREEVFGYRPETDWFGFGMLAARLLLNVEPYAREKPVSRWEGVYRQIEKPGALLSDLEQTLLFRLIAPNPQDRITRGYEVDTAIQEIMRALDRGVNSQGDKGALVLVINPRTCRELLDRVLELGFVPNPDKKYDAFNPNAPLHVAGLTEFVKKDLSRPQMYVVPKASYFLLIGEQLILQITPFQDDSGSTWDLAFCQGVGELRWNEGGAACATLPKDLVVVRTKWDLSNRTIRQNARNWERYLPTLDASVALRMSLSRFYDFLRCTNQLELLIRDSEIFHYSLVQHSPSPGVDRIQIKESSRLRPTATFCRIEGGMAEYLIRELESGKPDCNLVVLTEKENDGLMLPSITKTDGWKIEEINSNLGLVTLTRVRVGEPGNSPPREGVIRTWGMFGQVALIRRRKRAIDRIVNHSYLLRSLSSPGQVYMDTGSVPLPVPIERSLVDEAKEVAIQDILRVRPIYALQGPPGTGKTTLVAHLLRQIFEDDPVAQVLITAQAHGAVDVLRAKVRDEAFHGVSEEQQPLAVRLRPSDPNDSTPGEGSSEEVSLQILQKAKRRLKDLPYRTPLQNEWLNSVVEMESSFMNRAPESTAPDFCQMVKRGANVTYCTTSAGDLEVLAEENQSFDWTIVEEAGKAHGFDLALPLQAGHRWLLIGDHKQLPPYRFKDYREGLDFLDDAVNALEQLPDRGGGLLDMEWIRSWRDLNPGDQLEFKNYARQWLNTFERVFEYCSVATGTEKYTDSEVEGAAAGMLSHQHRMHPVIGDLISTTFYNGELKNQTFDESGFPLHRLRHPFQAPGKIHEKAIIWLDLPWSAIRSEFSEKGPSTGGPRFSNTEEIKALGSFFGGLRQSRDLVNYNTSGALTAAVLSPYNQQVVQINRDENLRRSIGDAGLVLKKALRNRPGKNQEGTKERVAHTVDSFQGNQADIIAVSLVRNNTFPIGQGLGFLDEAPRINVLLSRAERLLILVGSWEFFQHQLGAVTLDDPYHHLWHWKKVLSTLDEWFLTGRSIRIMAGQPSPSE